MIELRELCAGYGGREILHRISLTFVPGQVYGIIAPNGCGKSTLLRSITGLHPLSSGTVLLDGADLCSLTPIQTAQRVAYLPQSRNVPAISAGRLALHGRFAHLSYPRRYRREDDEITRRALEWTGAADFASRNMQELSGGQRQRVYLAMALAQDTRTILMDEPTTYLDIGSRFEVMNLARQLAGMGKAVVLVLHDLELVLRYADRVVVMDGGRVKAEGPPDEVYPCLRDCFGVEVCRISSPEGVFYSFSPKRDG